MPQTVAARTEALPGAAIAARPLNSPRAAGPYQSVLAIGFLIIAIMIATTTAIGMRRYHAEVADAGRELRTVDLLLAEEAGRSLQSVELVLDNAAEQIATEQIATPATFEERWSTQAVHDALRVRVAGIPQLSAVTIVNAAGKLINFSRYWPIPDVDLNDRDYIRYLREHLDQKTFLSRPVINRGSGTPTVYLARRIDAPDGTVLGFVLGAIELSYFQDFFASLHLDTGDVIWLWRDDGILLARYPRPQTGPPLPIDVRSTAQTALPTVATISETKVSVDERRPVRRLIATQAVGGFPLSVQVGRSKSLVLEDWRQEVIAIGAAVALAVICILVMMWALLRRFLAYEAVAAAFVEREGAVLARQQAEEALRQAQKMEAVGQLTGGVAHDFNNLLTVVQSSVDLLRRPSLPEERRVRYVNAISDAADRAAKLTSQLLAFARRQALKPEVFDAAVNLTAVCELIGRLTGSRVKVETRIPTTHCMVEADPNQFDTAIVNMAVNGRDAIEGQGLLTIAVEAVDGIPALRTDPPRAGTFIAVSVHDTGRGIPPDTLDRVFEPFFTTKRVGEGTGLGLSQVFGFAKQSGGDVAVESAPGRGTTFTLYLPRATAKPTVKPHADAHPAAVLGQGARVLVVEDNEQVGGSTVQTLDDLGFHAVWALNGEQALIELDAAPDGFDLVFSDVVMPGMSGIELCHVIRRRYADMPILLTSGYSDSLAKTGADGFDLLQKPYSLDDLAAALDKAVAHRRRLDQEQPVGVEQTGDPIGLRRSS